MHPIKPVGAVTSTGDHLAAEHDLGVLLDELRSLLGFYAEPHSSISVYVHGVDRRVWKEATATIESGNAKTLRLLDSAHMPLSAAAGPGRCVEVVLFRGDAP